MKKIIKLSLLTLGLTMCLSGCSIVFSSSSSSKTSSTEQTSSSSFSSYESSLDDGVLEFKNGSYFIESSTEYEHTFGNYSFELSNTSNYQEGYVSLSKGGYILNLTPFGDIDSFKVDYSIANPKEGETQSELGFGGLYYVTDTHKISNPRSYIKLDVNNGETITLDNNPNYIAFYTFNKINIEKITINFNKYATFAEKFENFDLNIFATNDIHGQVNPDDYHAGLVNAFGFIENYKTTYNLILDQGDCFQGSLACYLTKGNIMDDYFLMAGYDSVCLGNHEWDWGENNILYHKEHNPLMKFLACNIRYKDGSVPEWAQNYYITERGGVKFGVIGAIGNLPSDICADKIENISFIGDDPSKSTYELTNLISSYSDELKEKGCEYIILQIHNGSTPDGSNNFSGKIMETLNSNYEDVAFSKLKGKVDLALEAHTHRAYYHVDQYGISHIQGGNYLNSIGELAIKVTFNNDKPSFSINNVYLPSYNTIKSKTSSLFNIVNNWYSENVYKEECEKVVGSIPNDFTDSEINQMAADSYYNLINVYEELKPYHISVAGGHLVCRSPKMLKKGIVTMNDVANLFPFDDELLLVKINGRDLKYGFLNSSGGVFSGEFDASSRTDFNADYSVILDSFNYFFLTKVRTPSKPIQIVINLTKNHNIFPRDVLALYISNYYK